MTPAKHESFPAWCEAMQMRRQTLIRLIARAVARDHVDVSMLVLNNLRECELKMKDPMWHYWQENNKETYSDYKAYMDNYMKGLVV